MSCQSFKLREFSLESGSLILLIISLCIVIHNWIHQSPKKKNLFYSLYTPAELTQLRGSELDSVVLRHRIPDNLYQSIDDNCTEDITWPGEPFLLIIICETK